MMRTSVPRALVPVVVIAVALVVASAASAATYRVTKRTDPVPGPCTPNDCSLREAVRAANSSLGVADRIELPSRRPYRLSQAGIDEDGALEGDLDITNNRLTIVHPGLGRAIVNGGELDRVFQVFSQAVLRKLVIRNGNASSSTGYGGGIRASGRLTLVSSHVIDNEAAACGGGIHTEAGAPLVLRHSRVAGNSAGSDGGGISASCFGGSGPVTIEASTVKSNTGDANEDDIGRGGGIYLQTTAGVQSSIVRSTFARNRTGSEGGGIYTDLGRLRISASTISGNRAGALGGGIEVDGTMPLVVVNSTVVGNRTPSSGGGISLDAGTVRLNSVSVVRNRGNTDGLLSEAGGGLYDNGETFIVENSLIALNTVAALTPGDPPVKNDCSGADPFESRGQNLLSTRFLCDGFDEPGDIERSAPKLGRLRDNGGPTKTVALQAGSPARNRADAATAPSRDQRGIRRQDPDIGAFERR